MFSYYLKIAWRNLWNHKLFTSINIVSLAIGLSTSITIGMLVYFDMTFDTFHKDSDRIYRITSNFSSPQSTFYNAGVPTPLYEELKSNVRGLEKVAYFYNGYVSSVKNTLNGAIYKEVDDLIFTDENYFKLIEYTWLYGSSISNLTEPNKIVLTKNRAKKYFPNIPLEQVMGKILLYDNSISLEVVGIVDNFEKRSDFTFQEFISLKTAILFNDKQILSTRWDGTNSAAQVFVKVDEKTPIQEISTQLDQISTTKIDALMTEYNQTQKLHLQKLSDLHFNNNYGIFNSSTRGTASKSSLIGLSSIALFILLLGCINFINLNTAQATKRAKEIGVQKTLGASKRQVRFQMFGEMVILTFLATCLSVFFTGILLQLFYDFIPRGISFELLKDPFIIGFIVLLFALVSFLSGVYPTLILSNFKPSTILRNKSSSGRQSTLLRKYLTVFQFAIAQVFILGTLLVSKQLSFMMNKNMGFETNSIAFIYTPYQGNSIDKKMRFVKELDKIPSIAKVSIGSNPPASQSTNTSTLSFIKDGEEIKTKVQYLFGDTNYLNVYNIDLIAGRERLNDTIQEYIINESYLKILGFKNANDAIGQHIKTNSGKVPIVGVMKDFNQRSLKSTVKPMVLTGDVYRDFFSQFRSVHFEFTNNNMQAAIAKVNEKYQKIYPDATSNVYFMDDAIASFYRQEKKMSTLLNWAMGLSILISCLGLLGLVIHTTQIRTKEIGIRKVLGQKSSQITLLLSKEFMKLIGISIIIGMPIAYFFFRDWVSEFAYRVSINGSYFVISAVLTIVVALLTVSGQTIIASRRNPTETLKEE